MEQSDMVYIDLDLLEKLPFGLMALDSEHRIGDVNHTMGRLLDTPIGNLVGKRLDDLPVAIRQLLASEPKLFHDTSGQRWLRREVHGSETGQQLILLVDVTEQERLAEENARLRQTVEDLRLTDELTGLPNRRAIGQALDLHVSRSRRYANSLSVALVSIDFKQAADVRPLHSDPIALAVSRFLRDRLRWVDQIGRLDEHQFLLVLPETPEDDAHRLIKKINDEQDGMSLPEPYTELQPRLHFGLACWSKGDDVRTLMRRATEELNDDQSG